MTVCTYQKYEPIWQKRFTGHAKKRHANFVSSFTIYSVKSSSYFHERFVGTQQIGPGCLIFTD